MKFEFSHQFFFSKNLQISNFIKIRPAAAELFHSDGRMDVTKLTVALRNFTSAPKKQHVSTELIRFFWDEFNIKLD